MKRNLYILLTILAALACIMGLMLYIRVPGSVSIGSFLFPGLLTAFLVYNLLKK